MIAECNSLELSSCCSPALTAAAACKDVLALRGCGVGFGDGLCPRNGGTSLLFGMMLFVLFVDREEGRELRSGAIVRVYILLVRLGEARTMTTKSPDVDHPNR